MKVHFHVGKNIFFFQLGRAQAVIELESQPDPEPRGGVGLPLRVVRIALARFLQTKANKQTDCYDGYCSCHPFFNHLWMRDAVHPKTGVGEHPRPRPGIAFLRVAEDREELLFLVADFLLYWKRGRL